MDEQARIFVGIVSCGAFAAVLGGLFGALSGACYWQSGRAAGTRFGLRMADAFARVAERAPSRRLRGALVGATDGFLFLGLVGVASGGLAVAAGLPAGVLATLAAGAALLVAAAALFGLLAYAVVRNGVWGVCGVFGGGVSGAVAAAVLLGTDDLLLGAVPGLFAGALFSVWARRYAPEFHPPRPDAATPRPRREEVGRGSDAIRGREDDEEDGRGGVQL